MEGKMKKIKNLVFLMLLAVVSIFGISKVSAAGWKTYLNLPYGVVHSGSIRSFGTGTHRIMISVDGFNTSAGTLRTSGSTTMAIALMDPLTGHELNYDVSNYTYGTCLNNIMGSFSSGPKYYSFFSRIYNFSTGVYEYYDGVKADEVYMYPLPS
jgi:hypothetical protein